MVEVKQLRQVTAQFPLNEKSKDWQQIRTHDHPTDGEYVEVGKHKVLVRVTPSGAHELIQVRIIDDFDMVQSQTHQLIKAAHDKLILDGSPWPKITVCYRHVTIDDVHGFSGDFGHTVEDAEKFLLSRHPIK